MKFTDVIVSVIRFILGVQFTQENLDTQDVNEKFKTLELSIVYGLSF